MLNEERIKLMTRMAAYEKEKHNKNRAIVSFFKSDYISLQLMKSAIASTLVFAIVFGLYILYDFEVFMKEIYQMNLFDFAKYVIIIYLIFVGIISVITYITALYQYNKAMQSTKRFQANLRKMSRLYGEEEKRSNGPAGS